LYRYVRVHEYNRDTGFVQEYRNRTGPQGSKSSTRYRDSGVEHGYRESGIVQDYVGTGVVQGYKGEVIMQGYMSASVEQCYTVNVQYRCTREQE